MLNTQILPIPEPFANMPDQGLTHRLGRLLPVDSASAAAPASEGRCCSSMRRRQQHHRPWTQISSSLNNYVTAERGSLLRAAPSQAAWWVWPELTQLPCIHLRRLELTTCLPYRCLEHQIPPSAKTVPNPNTLLRACMPVGCSWSCRTPWLIPESFTNLQQSISIQLNSTATTAAAAAAATAPPLLQP